MKRFLACILLFFVVVFLCDFLYGFLCGTLYDNAKGGVYCKLEHFLYEDEYDVIVFGSSRACHHYNPSIISDSLSMTCFNAGCDGMGVVYASGLLSIILERYNPKLIILDCSPGYDIYVNPQDDGNLQYLSHLKPYSHLSLIKDILGEVSFYEYLKSYSAFYRYNSIFFDLLRENIMPSSLPSDGYMPISGKLDVGSLKPIKTYTEIDSVKIYSFVSFIKLAQSKRIPVVVFFSPTFRIGINSANNIAVNLCHQYNIPCYESTESDSINMNSEYFSDRVHLNSQGANVYTSSVCSVIKRDSICAFNTPIQ